MHTRVMRVLRGTAAAFFATFAAALSHQLAGAVAPSLFGVAVSLVLSTAVCTLFAGRTVSLARLTAAIVASQGMYHALFSSMLAPEEIAKHDMSAMTSSVNSAAHAANSSMSLLHLGAAAITVVTYSYAELALQGLLATARLLVSRLLGSVSPISVRGANVRLPLHSADVATFATRFLATMRYRGPPVAFSAA